MKFPVFLNDWYNSRWGSLVGEKALVKDFEINSKDLDGVSILLAHYDYENYEGYAFVLFERAGILYEVNGSHCSCYGLEGQWMPEEVPLVVLQHRVKHGTFGEGRFKNELKEVVEYLSLEPKT